MWGECWGFYSSEVLPPFLVEQVLSLQSKSSPCRASLILATQVLSLQSKSSPCRTSLILATQVLSLQSKSSGIWNVVGKSGPSFCQGLHTKNGLDLFLAHEHGPVGLVKPYLIFYPLQSSISKWGFQASSPYSYSLCSFWIPSMMAVTFSFFFNWQSAVKIPFLTAFCQGGAMCLCTYVFVWIIHTKIIY